MKTVTSPIRLALAALLLGAGNLPAAQAAVIGLDPVSPLSVTAGESLSIDVVVSELGAQIVSAFDLDVVFDAALLRPTAVSFGDLLGGADDALFEFRLLESIVDLAEVSFLSDAALDALQGDRVRVASVSFEALATGDTELSFDFPDGNDVKGRENAIIIDSTPQPPQPPEPVSGPGSLALLAGLAIGATGWRAQSRRR